MGEGEAIVASRDLSSPDGRPDLDGLRAFLSEAPEVGASGHRVVHGGERFRESALVNDDVLAAIDELGDVAPLHNPHAAAALRAVLECLPGLPAVACFDTAFHAGMPEAAVRYAVPGDWVERFGIRRFGFHGLSHAYASRRAAELLGRPASELRLVTCHLGAGASLCAVEGGRSVDTTMGFSPLDGLVMATRSGSFDPGALLLVVQRSGLSPDEIERVLTEESGLLALAGTGDMRELLARDDDAARLALGVYLHRLSTGIASMAAAMGGLDALVFTGGVGENSPRIRAGACEPLGFLGVALDQGANESAAGEEADLTAAGGAVRVLAVHAREELEIARETRRLVEVSS